MKRKKYKVIVKVRYTMTMDYEQTSKRNTKKDVSRVIENYLKKGTDIRNIFNDKPHIIYKVKRVINKNKNVNKENS